MVSNDRDCIRAHPSPFAARLPRRSPRGAPVAKRDADSMASFDPYFTDEMEGPFACGHLRSGSLRSARTPKSATRRVVWVHGEWGLALRAVFFVADGTSALPDPVRRAAGRVDQLGSRKNMVPGGGEEVL
jgi:hypothetical protein